MVNKLKDDDVREEDWHEDEEDDDYQEYEAGESTKKERLIQSGKKMNKIGSFEEKGQKKRHKSDAKNRYMRKHRDDYSW